jgi:mono/diheme cytochrome c family protein
MRRALVPFLLALSPAVAEEGAVTAGRQVFTENCEACHGPTATEGEAGDIRGLSVGTITGAVQGFEMMPRIPLTEAEIKAVAAYLRWLARTGP